MKDVKNSGKDHGKSAKSSASPKVPLRGYLVYLDLPGQKGLETFEKNLKILGATIEKCFSKEVKLVITNKGHPSDYTSQKKSGDHSVGSPGALPSPFSVSSLRGSVDSPSGVIENRPMTRGKAIAGKVNLTRTFGSTNVIENAKQWKIRIVHYDPMQRWVTAEMEKLPSKSRPESKKRDGDLPKRNKIKTLRGACIKFESMCRNYRPLHREMEKFPSIQFNSMHRMCPFDTQGSKSRQQFQEYMDQAEGDEERDGNGQEERADGSWKRDLKKRKNPEAAGDPRSLHPKRLMTAGEVRRLAQARARAERKKGFCELCEEKYDNIDKHVRQEYHKKFVQRAENYSTLDEMIDTGPNLERFLSTVDNTTEYPDGTSDRAEEGIKLLASFQTPKSEQKLPAFQRRGFSSGKRRHFPTRKSPRGKGMLPIVLREKLEKSLEEDSSLRNSVSGEIVTSKNKTLENHVLMLCPKAVKIVLRENVSELSPRSKAVSDSPGKSPLRERVRQLCPRAIKVVLEDTVKKPFAKSGKTVKNLVDRPLEANTASQTDDRVDSRSTLSNVVHDSRMTCTPEKVFPADAAPNQDPLNVDHSAGQTCSLGGQDENQAEVRLHNVQLPTSVQENPSMDLIPHVETSQAPNHPQGNHSPATVKGESSISKAPGEIGQIEMLSQAQMSVTAKDSISSLQIQGKSAEAKCGQTDLHAVELGLGDTSRVETTQSESSQKDSKLHGTKLHGTSLVEDSKNSEMVSLRKKTKRKKENKERRKARVDKAFIDSTEQSAAPVSNSLDQEKSVCQSVSARGDGFECTVLKSKYKKLSLNESWSVLSDRSMYKMLQDSSDDEEFHGFDAESIQDPLPSDVSYEEVSEVFIECPEDLSSDSQEGGNPTCMMTPVKEFLHRSSNKENALCSSPEQVDYSSDWDSQVDSYVEEHCGRTKLDKSSSAFSPAPLRRSPRKSVQRKTGVLQLDSLRSHDESTGSRSIMQPAKHSKPCGLSLMQIMDQKLGDTSGTEELWSGPVIHGRRTSPRKRKGNLHQTASPMVNQCGSDTTQKKDVYDFGSPVKSQRLPMPQPVKSPLGPSNDTHHARNAPYVEFNSHSSPQVERTFPGVVSPLSPVISIAHGSPLMHSMCSTPKSSHSKDHMIPIQSNSQNPKLSGPWKEMSSPPSEPLSKKFFKSTKERRFSYKMNYFSHTLVETAVNKSSKKPVPRHSRKPSSWVYAPPKSRVDWSKPWTAQHHKKTAKRLSSDSPVLEIGSQDVSLADSCNPLGSVNDRNSQSEKCNSSVTLEVGREPKISSNSVESKSSLRKSRKSSQRH